jgi:predicted Zn-dependent protease
MSVVDSAAGSAAREAADIAAEVIDLVGRAAAGADAEVLVDRTDYALTRFANSFIHQNVAERTVGVRLRVHVQGRTAAGSTTLTDPDALRDLVDRTLAAARLCPPDPQWPGLAGPAPTQPGPPVDEATAHASPEDRASRVRAFVAAADGLETAGYCSTLRWTSTFANSAGQTASAESAQAVLDGIARAGAVAGSPRGAADGLARLAAARLADLDGTVLGRRAAQKARAATNPTELPPGRYEVVMEPTAVADLLTVIAFYGLNGKAVNERRSFVELGAQQFDPTVSLVDDPFAVGSTALPFDCEGTPRQRLAFVDGGTTTAVAHDRRTAAQAGAASTGHALPGGAAAGAIPVALRLLPGPADGPVGEVDGPAADTAVAALVAQVERGLLVTDNWYTRVLDPRTLVVTGLTRNGLWLIENGQVTEPVQNLRFTQSYPEALAPGAVLGLGNNTVAIPNGWWEGMTLHAPALRLRSWNYTGNATG